MKAQGPSQLPKRHVAFAGLLSAPIPPVRSAGGPDDAAGGSAQESNDAGTQADQQQGPLQVPRQPAPPVRLPRREQQMPDLFGGPSSAWSGASSAVSSSSSSSRAAQAAVSAAGFSGLQPQLGPRDAATQEGRSRGTPREASPGPSEAPTSAAEDEQQDWNKKQRDPPDYGGYCCFREPRKYRSRHEGRLDATTSQCAAIREDRPETYHRDVPLLELRSLLLRHAVEPTDPLVADLLRWQQSSRQSPPRS